VRLIVRAVSTNDQDLSPDPTNPAPTLQLLMQKFMRGEISADEYESAKQAIQVRGPEKTPAASSQAGAPQAPLASGTLDRAGHSKGAGPTRSRSAVAQQPWTSYVERRHWQRAETYAFNASVLALLLVVLSGIGTIFLTFQTDPACDLPNAECGFVDRYPYFGIAFSSLLLVVLLTSVVLMVAAYIAARASSALASQLE
jgi:hypothetical protein